jgi:S-adenosylmethionine hydrolase
MAQRPIVALLTDFGGQDHYAGAVRGAVLAACPEATLVDIAHDLEAHDVLGGAYALCAAYPAFPAGAVFVAVVDPGVGSARRGLAVEAGGYRFVGPDNGILSLMLAEQPGARVHELTNRGLFRYEVAATFHARDVFAPVAGHLAQGSPLELVGPPVSDPVRLELEAVGRPAAGEWLTRVLHVDRFGNLTTHLDRRAMDEILAEVGGDATRLVALVEGAVVPFVHTYSDVPEGEACALLGGSGRLEIAVHRGSAARVLGAGKGAPVRLRSVSATGA